ncbi:MAG TPA: agmatinase [Anaerolineales bacterium]|nr:agmatinase [Anaerolineales bacterium]
MTDSAFGESLQPFAGIASFMRRPVTRAVTPGDVAIVGVPFDSGTSYRSGARFGPRGIREASLMLWGYNNAQHVKPLERLNVIDAGDVDTVPPSIEQTYAHIQAEVGRLLTAGATVVALGGDHSVTLPLLRAQQARHGPLSVIHIDAHPDTWANEYAGQPYSHGTPFRRALEEGLIRPEAYLQIGLRGPTTEAGDLDEARRLGARLVTCEEAVEQGIPSVVESARRVLKPPIYLSLDIDAADPAFAPGTGTPEVGGFTSQQMLNLVRGLSGLDIVGFDLVEVAPPFDPAGITSILAANLVFEMLSLLALRRPPA